MSDPKYVVYEALLFHCTWYSLSVHPCRSRGGTLFIMVFIPSSLHVPTQLLFRIGNKCMAEDELDSQKVVGQVHQFFKEQDFNKQGRPLTQGDEQKAVREAENIVGIETQNTDLASDPSITQTLLAALYKHYARPTEEALAVAEAAQMFAGTKDRLHHPLAHGETLPPQELLAELEHQRNKLWLRIYAEFHIGTTKPRRLIQWLTLQQEIVETNQRITPSSELAAEVKLYPEILEGDNTKKAGYCYMLEAQAAEEAGALALSNNPKYKESHVQARIWQNLGDAWANMPEQNESKNTG